MSGPARECGSGEILGIAGALFQHATDALLLVDPLSECVLDANDLACTFCELAREELLGLSLRALLRHEQEWHDWPPLHEPSFAAKEGFLLRAGQAERWVEVGVRINRVPLPGAGLVALVALADRRDEVELTRRLRRAEAELRCILASSSDGLWSCRIDRAGGWRYRYLSPGVQRLTGRNVALFHDDPQAWEGCIDPDDLPAWRHFRERLRAGCSAAAEYRLRGPGGAVTWVHESVVATPEEGGWVLTGVLTDVSGRRREPRAAPPAPAERLDGVAGLAGAVAHDFNNFLTGILGHISLARMSAPTSEGLDPVEEITLRAAEFCKQLSVVAGRSRGGGRTHGVAGVIRKALAPWESRPDVPALRVEVPADLPGVLLDEAQLAQAVEALARNALEATDGGGGEVVVRAGAKAPAAIDGSPGFSFRAGPPTGPVVWVEVRDGGPGIPEAALARLGEPYVNARPGHRGWGLALVLGILRAGQGGLEIYTGRVRGTIVRLLLPAAGGSIPAAPALPARAEESAEGHPRGTVLLADDEQTVREVAARLLQAVGCEVVAVSDGEEAVAWLAEHGGEARLAIVDLTMPRLCGEPLLREMRRLAPDLPVVVMSGYPEGDVVPRLTGANLAGYLQKPFRLPALAELLRRVLPPAPAAER